MTALAFRLPVPRAELYVEVSGDGPPVLLIAGAGGDAGLFDGVAERLSKTCTVAAYDRRGNSRSVATAGWQRTDLAEQADDAAAVIAALGAGPAVVFGSSSGGAIALVAALRHGDHIRAAAVHEPSFVGALTDGPSLIAGLAAQLEEERREHGDGGALERFLDRAGGIQALAHVAPAVAMRVRDNGGVFIDMEFMPFSTWSPAPGLIRRLVGRLELCVGDSSPPFIEGIVHGLGRAAGCEPRIIPGSHLPYLTHPDAVADVIDEFVRGDRAEGADRRS